MGRTITLSKSGIQLKLNQIKGLFEDEQALCDVTFYWQYKRLGLPRQNWEECLARQVEIVLALKDLDEIYYPSPAERLLKAMSK